MTQMAKPPTTQLGVTLKRCCSTLTGKRQQLNSANRFIEGVNDNLEKWKSIQTAGAQVNYDAEKLRQFGVGHF